MFLTPEAVKTSRNAKKAVPFHQQLLGKESRSPHQHKHQHNQENHS
jgi:hypothetical protein